MITDQQKIQHEHFMQAFDHLQMAGLKDVTLIEALTLLSTVFIGDKEKMTEVLTELAEYEQTRMIEEELSEQNNPDENIGEVSLNETSEEK